MEPLIEALPMTDVLQGVADADATCSDPPIANPCINICRMDLSGKFCQGCRRTAVEIGLWDRMSASQKMEIVCRIERHGHVQKRGGNAILGPSIESGMQK